VKTLEMTNKMYYLLLSNKKCHLTKLENSGHWSWLNPGTRGWLGGYNTAKLEAAMENQQIENL